jgi:hypothetical protein
VIKATNHNTIDRVRLEGLIAASRALRSNHSKVLGSLQSTQNNRVLNDRGIVSTSVSVGDRITALSRGASRARDQASRASCSIKKTIIINYEPLFYLFFLD